MRKRLTRIARIVLRVAAVVAIVFLLIETAIRWLPPGKPVITTTEYVATGSSNDGTYRVTRLQRTETLVAPKDASAIQRISAAFSDSGVEMLPIISNCRIEPSFSYGLERYAVIFYWHGFPTQVWQQEHYCGEWLRSSGGVPDLWGRGIVLFQPPHLPPHH
jgi:hypothetical protein